MAFSVTTGACPCAGASAGKLRCTYALIKGLEKGEAVEFMAN